MRRADDGSERWREGPGPDLLTGFDHAGERLAAVLADTQRRLLLANDGKTPANHRIADIRVHTQYRQDYATTAEKHSIIEAAENVLDETLLVNEPEAEARFEEALAAMQVEEERIFICVVLGNHLDLVYWNWRYGYSVSTCTSRHGRVLFATDLDRRRVASPALAARRYGETVIAVSKRNRR